MLRIVLLLLCFLGFITYIHLEMSYLPPDPIPNIHYAWLAFAIEVFASAFAMFILPFLASLFASFIPFKGKSYLWKFSLLFPILLLSIIIFMLIELVIDIIIQP
jgi:hypothetical protein